MIDATDGMTEGQPTANRGGDAMPSSTQPAQASRSPIETTIEINDSRASCRADEWVRFGDWLADEHGVRSVEITTPFAVATRAEQADAEGPDGCVFAFLFGDPEDENSDGDGFGAWVDPNQDAANFVPQILAQRWPRVTFTLPTPAGVLA